MVRFMFITSGFGRRHLHAFYAFSVSKHHNLVVLGSWRPSTVFNQANQVSPSEPKSPSDTVEVSSPTMSHVTEIGRFRDAAERELSA